MQRKHISFGGNIATLGIGRDQDLGSVALLAFAQKAFDSGPIEKYTHRVKVVTTANCMGEMFDAILQNRAAELHEIWWEHRT